MYEKITGSSFQVFLINDGGTIAMVTDPKRAQNLQDKFGFRPMPMAEGEATFVQRREIVQNLGIHQE
ncbi:MAG: hypothetical protein WC841_04905 [Candidatus Shapirobacteria bacterium]|jgi:hypothetical protein